MEKFITATGNTIDLAIEAALRELKLDRDSVSVEVLENPKSGFLGFGASPAKVKVTYEVPDEPQRPAPALSAASRSKPKKAERGPVVEGKLKPEEREALRTAREKSDEDRHFSGIEDRPFCRGRAYKPVRYGRDTSGPGGYDLSDEVRAAADAAALPDDELEDELLTAAEAPAGDAAESAAAADDGADSAASGTD